MQILWEFIDIRQPDRTDNGCLRVCCACALSTKTSWWKRGRRDHSRTGSGYVYWHRRLSLGGAAAREAGRARGTHRKNSLKMFAIKVGRDEVSEGTPPILHRKILPICIIKAIIYHRYNHNRLCKRTLSGLFYIFRFFRQTLKYFSPEVIWQYQSVIIKCKSLILMTTATRLNLTKYF